MKVHVRQSGNVTVLEPEGKLGYDDRNGLGLRNAVLDAMSGGAARLIINFERVTTVSSSGLGELVGTYTSVTNRGGRIVLCSLSPSHRQLFRLTQIDTVFDLYDTEAEATASF